MANYQSDVREVFQALADPTRLAVIGRLARGPQAVSELAKPFDMALPSFIKHLAVLEKADLVSTSKAGRTRTCHMRPEAMREAASWLEEQRAIWEARTVRLADYAENLAQTEKANERQ